MTLVEALVALTLLGVVGTIGVRTLLAHERQVRTARHREHGRLAADEVVRVLTATLRYSVATDSLRLLGDTSVALTGTVGVALACAAAHDSVVVPAVAGVAAWWDVAPDSGDVVVIESVQGTSTLHQVRAARRRSGSGACGESWRFDLAPALPVELGVVVVRVLRPVRLVVYRGSDGAWWWGERRCASLAWTPCGPAQPIAGPLAAPRGGVLLARDGDRVLAAVRSGTALRRAAITRAR